MLCVPAILRNSGEQPLLIYKAYCYLFTELPELFLQIVLKTVSGDSRKAEATI